MHGLHEECGVFGIFDNQRPLLSEDVYYGLFALQHRGQESCGMAVSRDGRIDCHKGMGLVGEVFSSEVLQLLHGHIAVGHVRYSTTGGSIYQNAQPLVTHYAQGTFAIAHNGNLTNTEALRGKLGKSGAIFQTETDSEVLAYLIAGNRMRLKSLEEAVSVSMKELKGAYALLLMSKDKLIAARDRFGFKPLCIGQTESGYVFASESCALDCVGATFLRDVLPGEVVVCDASGLHSLPPSEEVMCSRCVFEYIYFARPDSVIDGISVYESRIRAGRLLARQHPVDADVVIGVPESGMDAASGYALESGIPMVRGFVKNNYIGRTFIKPNAESRKASVAIKLNPIRASVLGKRVVMIDDSIVRGTTIARIVGMLKSFGALEVHVRVSAPPFLFPCYYGTDVPSGEHLIAKHMTVKQIADHIGADTLGYLEEHSLQEMLGLDNKAYCDACFSGEYKDGVADSLCAGARL